MFINRLIATTVGLLLAEVSSFAVSYYVAPNAAAGGTGSVGSPFQTIAQARDAIKALGTLTEDANVYLRSGWYTQTSTLTFDATHSGSGNHKIVYQAYPGEYPVISGGTQITGWSRVGSTNVWSAPAPVGIGNRQLYVNCIRAIRAHRGSGLSGATQTATGFTTSENAMQNWGNKSNIEFTFVNPTCGWSEKRATVASISGTTITMADPGWSSIKAGGTYGSIGTTTPTDVENAYELLDQPGEWYLNRTTSTMYYIPRTGEDMGTAIVIAPVIDGTLVSITGNATAKISNIQFIGITFAHATWLDASEGKGYQETQCGFGGSGTTNIGNVDLQYSNAIRFERCTFKHLGAMGLYMRNGSTNNSVVGCVFTEISGNCIAIGSTGDAARSNQAMRDTCDTVANCYIHDSPVEYRGGCGVWTGYVANIALLHNEMCYTPYSTVAMGWGWGATSYQKNNQVAYNNFHHYLQKLQDGGAIYNLSSSPGTRWHHNYGHDVVGPDANWRMWYTDEGSAYITIDSNVAEKYGPGVTWYSAWTSSIHDITIRDNYVDVNRFQNNGTNCPITNTTIVSNSVWPATAQSIMNNAGIQPSFANVKTMQCACSMVSPNGLSSVAVPVISKAEGAYFEPVVDTLTCLTAGAEIRYTLDGTNPTGTSLLYSTPLTFSRSATIKAVGIKNGLTNSAIVTAAYTISVAPLQFSPQPGYIPLAQQVSITSATSGVTIRYTTDGSTPTPTLGTTYTGPFSLSASTITVKAIGFRTDMDTTAILSGIFNVGQYDPASGLILRMPFDASSGTTLTDISGLGNNGIVQGTPGWITGKKGNALRLNGTNAWATVANSSSLSVTTGASWMMWLRSTEVATYKPVFTHSSMSLMTWMGNGTAELGITTNVTSYYIGYPWNGTLNDGTWHHFAMTYSSTTGAVLYKDGVPMTCADCASTSGTLVPSTIGIRIGSWDGSSFAAIDLDEMRIYSRTLTQGEIQLIMNLDTASASINGSMAAPYTKLLQTGIFQSAKSLNISVADAGKHDIAVVDMLGKTVCSVEGIGQKEYRLADKAFGPGLYIVRLKTMKNVLTKKIVVN